MSSRRWSALALGLVSFVIWSVQIWLVDPDDRLVRTPLALGALVLAVWASQRWRNQQP